MSFYNIVFVSSI